MKQDKHSVPPIQRNCWLHDGVDDEFIRLYTMKRARRIDGTESMDENILVAAERSLGSQSFEKRMETWRCD